MRRKQAGAGFTLIELLVVIAIIMIIASMTIFLVGGFFKGTAVKEGGRIISATFARGRQQASSARLVHFLVFDFGNCVMRLHADRNRDRVFTGADPMEGELMPLPKNVYFDRISGQTSGAPYVAFQPDGSVAFYTSSGAAYPDVSWTGTYTEGSFTQAPPQSDIVLRLGSDPSDPSDKVYVDVMPVTGMIRKFEYYHRTSDTGVLP